MLRAAGLLLLVAVAAAVGLVAAGCGDASAPVTKTALDGKTFVSTSITGHDTPDGAVISLGFEQERLSASVGCNQIIGAYSVADGKLRQSKAIRTQMACPGLDKFETWLADLLAAGADATLEGDTLTLEGDGAKVVLKAAAAKPSTPSVVGTMWTLVEAAPSGAAQLDISKTAPPTLHLTDDGKASLFTSCNRGGGTATFADGFVTFGPIATTRMACEPAAMKLEHFYLGVLKGKAAAGFDGEGRLSLAKSGDRLLFESK